jgi:hypothetical protein
MGYPVNTLTNADGIIESRHLDNDLAGAGGFMSPLPIKTICGFQDDETWTPNASCTLEPDTADFKHGRQSLKMTVTGSNATATCTLPFAIGVRGNIGLMVKVDDLAKVGSLWVYIYESATKYYKVSLYVSEATPVNNCGLVNDTWRMCWMRRDQFVGTGTPTAWGDGTAGSVDTYPVYKVMLQLVPVTDQTPIVHFGWLANQEFPAAGVIFHFDDAYGSVATRALPIFQSYGFKGCVAVTGSLVGTGVGENAFLTESQIDTLYAAGWDVLSHNYTHVSATSSTVVADQVANLSQGQRYLRNKGWHRGSHFLAWPGNNGDNTERNAGLYASKFFLAARGNTQWAADNPISDGEGKSGLWIPRDPYNLAFQPMCEDCIATATALVEQVVRDRGIITFYAHRVKTSPDGSVDIDPTTLDTLLALCKTHETAGNLEVLTTSQWAARTIGRPGFFRVDGGSVPRGMMGDGSTVIG